MSHGYSKCLRVRAREWSLFLIGSGFESGDGYSKATVRAEICKVSVTVTVTVTGTVTDCT